ncbi:MAG: LuxR family transcriptional regulator [Bradyrhizobium sp.]|nr:MAG: LuxR family transcriptional regulator [Bradyrhizobium sp.]
MGGTAMTPTENQRVHPAHPASTGCGDQVTGEIDAARLSAERTRAVNEVGSAIAHQIADPLTSLRLYVGEIRRHAAKFYGPAEAQGHMLKMVEAMFQETERVCAMIAEIADSFEQPLCPETAAALGRDVTTWWSRTREANGRDLEETIAIREVLSRREREVLAHISQGCSNKQGAARLLISPRTFESHRARIMKKLGAKNGADLVRISLGENSVTL